VNGRCPAPSPTEDVVVADSAYGTYVDFISTELADASFVNIMRVTAIFVGAKLELATISSPRPQRCPQSMAPDE